MPLKSQLEISMIKQLNRKRITTKIIRNISDIKYLLNDPEAVFLIQEMSQPLAESTPSIPSKLKSLFMCSNSSF